MDGVEASGSTVEEAIENALDQLDLDRDEVEVEILDETEGQAHVRVTPLEELDDDEAEGGEAQEDGDAGEADVARRDDAGENASQLADESAVAAEKEEDLDEAEFAAQMLDHLLALMNIDADVSIRDPETPGDGLGMANAVLDIEGEDLGILIGRRGETLGSLQYLLNLMVAQKLGRQEFFTVDVEGYRRRRENSLTTLARRMADQVKRTGRPVTLEPMPANERRIIHLTLSESRFVSTESIGEGEDRQVAIQPKRGRE